MTLNAVFWINHAHALLSLSLMNKLIGLIKHECLRLTEVWAPAFSNSLQFFIILITFALLFRLYLLVIFKLQHLQCRPPLRYQFMLSGSTIMIVTLASWICGIGCKIFRNRNWKVLLMRLIHMQRKYAKNKMIKSNLFCRKFWLILWFGIPLLNN